MTIVFFSNVLNSHQIAFADALYEINNKKFYFIQTGELNATRKAMGFKSYERPYLISTVEDGDLAQKLAVEADVAIFGAESFKYLALRINKSDKLTFSYSERWLKKGLINIISPTIFRQYILYLKKGRYRNWNILASGGFLAGDLKRLGIFKNRVFQWGYFPRYNILEKEVRVTNKIINILWVATFIKLKRPDFMIRLAKRLVNSGYNFQLTMIGGGELAEDFKNQVKNNPLINQKVIIHNYMPHDKVEAIMNKSDIFCFTSNRLEGWGAVLGEAMASGCCPVSSSAAGATPVLIRNGENGLIFKSDDFNDFYDKVIFLLNNKSEMRRMGSEAKKTMLSNWNADSAARELLSLAQQKLKNPQFIPTHSNKPGSLAQIYKI